MDRNLSVAVGVIFLRDIDVGDVIWERGVRGTGDDVSTRMSEVLVEW